MADLEDLQRQTDFTVAGRGDGERKVTFLPEPPRQTRR